MNDPYVYKNSTVLLNKLNIMNEAELTEVEAQLFIANLVSLDEISAQININSIESLKDIHHHLFKDLYVWAGHFRTVNIYKEEKVLHGLSVTYCDYNKIGSTLESIFTKEVLKKINRDNIHLVEDFTKFIVDLWRVHPFREGNTRTLSVYLKLLTNHKSIYFNDSIIAENPNYFRSALALAAVEEAPEDSFLMKMMRDVLSQNTLQHGEDNKIESSSTYKVIGNMDTTKMNESYFTTEEIIDNE